ncbi:sulfurtransferase, partial [Xanthomonas sp. Kuri4-2]
MITNTAAYHFTVIDDPQALAAAVRERAEAGALKGTVLVAGEGINLFLAGQKPAIDAFYAWLRPQPGFGDLRIKYSLSAQLPFARLKVKVKPEIISFRRDDASPLAGRAPAVAPARLQ